MPEAIQLTTPQADSTQTQRAPGSTGATGSYASTGLVSTTQNSVDYMVNSWRANQQIEPSNTGASFGSGISQSPTGTISASKPEMRSQRILGMNKWVGSITAIEDGILTAELFPSDHEGPALVADFALSLLSPDESLASPGSIVYLTTRTIDAGWGQRTATTQLRLRRPWHWSAEELDKILAQARVRARTLQGHARRRT
jgi:hypothetical protein